MAPEDDLKSLRVKIRETDEEILKLIARRMQLASQVGEYKLARNLPIKDFNVEKEVIESARKRAVELGFYEDLAEEVLSTLIRFSCWLQDEHHAGSRRRAQGAQKKARVTIVGGLGPMGQWLAQYFDSFGHTISLCDLRTSPGEASRYPNLRSLPDAVAGAEIVVLATPITATSGVIDELTRIGTRALVFDICSLKTPLIAAIARAVKGGLRIASVHPMFGPRAEMLSGRNILICEAGVEDATRAAEALFRESTARLVRVPLESHDEWMAYILGASHLANLLFAGTLGKSGFSYSELSALGSTTFTSQARVTLPVVKENQDLYYEIQAENRFTPDLLAALEASLGEYGAAIRERDRASFKALMEKGRRYFSAAAKEEAPS